MSPISAELQEIEKQVKSTSYSCLLTFVCALIGFFITLNPSYESVVENCIATSNEASKSCRKLSSLNVDVNRLFTNFVYKDKIFSVDAGIFYDDIGASIDILNSEFQKNYINKAVDGEKDKKTAIARVH